MNIQNTTTKAIASQNREIVCIGWDSVSNPIYRYRDELDMADHLRARVPDKLVIKPGANRDSLLECNAKLLAQRDELLAAAKAVTQAIEDESIDGLNREGWILDRLSTAIARCEE